MARSGSKGLGQVLENAGKYSNIKHLWKFMGMGIFSAIKLQVSNVMGRYSPQIFH